MHTKDWQQIEELFHSAMAREASERSLYLSEVCFGDESLQLEVESLIQAFENSNGLMEQPAFELGMKVLCISQADSMVGKVVGVYKIVRLLGKGGMGEVYLAEDSRLGRKVALKFLSPEFVGDNWAKRQLIKEAQAVAMLDHPNICPVHGIEEHEDHSFIVMQYVEGETLADMIRKQALSADRVLLLAQQMVGALAEAHAHGIIHRDIKPRNIMVTSGGQAKVLDFGLAKTIQQKQSSEKLADSISHLSQSGLVPGTVAYMSPEQLRGERLDFRSDIFSLGTVLYELIQGKNPFARASEAETISAILTNEPPVLRNVSLELSRNIDRIVNRCLEKDRGKRYNSASELLVELGDIQNDRNDRFGWVRYPGAAVFAVLAFVILAVAMVFVYFSFGGFRSQEVSRNARASPNAGQTPVPSAQSLAVLPFSNESGDKSIDYLIGGLTESLINKFSAVSELRVSPYTSVSGYQGKTLDPQLVGRELNAAVVLLAKIMRQGKSLVLQSSLIRTVDGSLVWAGRHNVDVASLISLEDELAKNVTDILALRLENEARFMASHGTASPEAFRQYMLGRHYWRNRDRENIKKAIGYFNESIRLDPLYAQGWSGLADSYVLLAEAHTSLGVVSLRFEWKWQEAEKELKRAIELKPDYAPCALLVFALIDHYRASR